MKQYKYLILILVLLVCSCTPKDILPAAPDYTNPILWVTEDQDPEVERAVIIWHLNS